MRLTLTDKEETITITLKRYKELVEAENQLQHLQAKGVDNWEGYTYYGTDEDWADE